MPLPTWPALPLHADYFSRKPLLADRAAAYEASAKAHLGYAIERLDVEREMYDTRPRTWSHASVSRLPFRNEFDEHGYTVLERDGARVRFKTHSKTGRDIEIDFACHYDIDGHPNELMELMYADNTLDLRTWGKIYFSSFYMDSAVLHCLQRKPEEGPIEFSGLCWMALRVPVRTANNTDVCFHKLMGSTVDVYGQEVQYMLLTSVDDVPNCPLQERSLGLVRSQIRIAMLLQSSSKGTRMSIFGQIEPHISISLPTRTVESLGVALLQSLGNLSIYLESYRITKRPFVDRLKWVPDGARRACYLCRQSFSFFRNRHHCRSCGEIMCKKCMVLRPLYHQLAQQNGTIELTGEKFCKPCVLFARTIPPKKERKVANPFVDASYDREPLRWSTFDRVKPKEKETRRSSDAVIRSKAIDIRTPVARATNLVPDSPLSTSAKDTKSPNRYLPLSQSMPGATKYMDTPKADSAMVAQQLWQISCKANATWNFAKESIPHLSRHSTPISTPRDEADMDMRDSLHKMNQSLAEQAYLLEAIDRASKGRYSVTSPMNIGRYSVTSPLNVLDETTCERTCVWDDHRFEMIPDIAS
ncbi:hypothetical protein AeMF1_012522 [Aphanomyces euteiches]|nr:hypothetical protein AeMF1_012522 [Aphanomyces euteiches]